MITFRDDHSARLKRMTPALLVPALGEELLAGAEAVVEDTRASILDGAISGSGHIPSAPGEPPNADTHHLDQSLRVGDLIETSGTIQTSAINDADYALALEKGTSRMVERPSLGPAVRRQQIPVFEALLARWRDVVGL